MNQNLILKVDDIVHPIFEWLYNDNSTLFNWVKILWGNKKHDGDNLYKIHSGEKWLSFKISKIEESETWSLNRRYISDMFGRKWAKYWDTLNLDYIPNDNFRLEKDEVYHARDSDNIVEKNSKDTVDAFKRRYDSIENLKNKANTDTTTLERNSSSSLNDESTDNASSSAEQIYGFNSNDGTDSNRTDGRDITKVVTNNTNQDNNNNNTNTNEKVIEDKSKNDSEHENRNLSENERNNKFKDSTRSNKKESDSHGLDKASNQELLTEELELRRVLFLDIVFNDLDSFITIPCY